MWERKPEDPSEDFYAVNGTERGNEARNPASYILIMIMMMMMMCCYFYNLTKRVSFMKPKSCVKEYIPIYTFTPKFVEPMFETTP